MYGRPLDADGYDASRWIVEPFHLFDCCQENDGAAAMVLVAGRAGRRLPRSPPCYVLGAQCRARSTGPAPRCTTRPSTPRRASPPSPPASTSMAGLGPGDVDVLQSYENFTGGVLMSIVEHGFCTREEVNDFLTVDNLLAPTAGCRSTPAAATWPSATCTASGLNIEAVRQIRGESTCQVPDADVALVGVGPDGDARQLVDLRQRGHAVTRPPYLRPGPRPAARPDARRPRRPVLGRASTHDELLLQRCNALRRLAVGPGVVLPPLPLLRPALRGDTGRRACIYSHERVWHPVHPALAEQGPYVVVLVELPAGRRRAHGRQPARRSRQDLTVGAPVVGVFEHHADADVPHTLLQWVAA